MKNKILKILSLIAICTLMIASLCSFTTVETPGDDDIAEYDYVYTPSMDLKVGYCYHRTTATIDKKYYGYLFNPHNTVVREGDVTKVKNMASDYYINADTAIKYHSTTHQDLPSQYNLSGSYLAASVVMGSQKQSTYFTGSLIYSGLQKISEIDPWNEVCFYDENINGFEPLDMREYAWFIEIYTVDFSDGEYVRNRHYAMYVPGDPDTPLLSLSGTFGGINLSKVVDYFVQRDNIESEFIDYVTISGLEYFYQFPMIKIIDVLRPDSDEGKREYMGLINYYDSLMDDLENTITMYKTQYNSLYTQKQNMEKQYQADIAAIQEQLSDALERIKAFEEGKENASAITLLFDGIYKTIYNVLTIFFNMDFFGAKLGSVVGLLLGAAVVIIILKVVL